MLLIGMLKQNILLNNFGVKSDFLQVFKLLYFIVWHECFAHGGRNFNVGVEVIEHGFYQTIEAIKNRQNYNQSHSYGSYSNNRNNGNKVDYIPLFLGK